MQNPDGLQPAAARQCVGSAVPKETPSRIISEVAAPPVLSETAAAEQSTAWL